MTVGEKIRVLRTNNNMSQAALAGRVPISEDAVQKWEVGKNTPCLEDLKKISEIFCIDLMELIDDEKEIFNYVEEEARNMLDNFYCVGDSEHDVYDAGLAKNAKLHRFKNYGGILYSAIYLGNFEAFSCERSEEAKMIAYWNSID